MRKAKAARVRRVGRDNPEWTRADFVRARPAHEVVADVVAAARRFPGKQRAPAKRLISMRLDRDVIEEFRATGPGWQSRINEALRRAVRRKKKR
jgi:uncharacterized protein (DUF4415 family)